MKMRSLLAIGTALLLLVPACDETTGPETVAEITLSPATGTLGVGEAAAFTAQARNEAGKILSRTILWSSSDQTIATVDGNGRVTGLAPGTARIKATVDGKSATAEITVHILAVASVTVRPGTVSFGQGNSMEFTAAIQDAQGRRLQDRVITWSSSDLAIAKVSPAGVVTAVRGGVATISATSEGKTGSAEVTVIPYASMTGSLSVPAAAAGMQWLVAVDTDLDAGNGFVTSVAGIVGPGGSFAYSLDEVPPGAYFAYATACGAANCAAKPSIGDYLGLYGTPMSLVDLSIASGPVGTPFTASVQTTFNITIPSTGVVGDIDIALSRVDQAPSHISVGGVRADELCETDSTGSGYTIAGFMPNAGAAGTHQVVISHFGALSNPQAWTQQGLEDATDPANDTHAHPTRAGLPMGVAGSFLGSDVNDWYSFKATADSSYTFSLQWNAAKDLDFHVHLSDGVTRMCGGTTAGMPEKMKCLLPAGLYLLHVRDQGAAAGDHSPVSYQIIGEMDE